MQTKNIASILLLLAAGAAAGAGQAADTSDDGASRARVAASALIGQPGPSATLTTLDGKPIELAKLYGKQPIYLKFWATWCAPCREQMPHFEQVYQKYGKRIAVVAVNAGYSDTPADVRSYRAQYGLHMPTVIDDGSLAAQLHLRVTPQHVLIGRDGRIVHVGHLADQQLDAALERAAADQSTPAALALAPASPKAPALKPGDVVPPLEVTTVDGKHVALGQGKARALLFFSPWCESYLRDSRPAIAKACARMRVESARLARMGGIEWLAISAPIWASEQELAAYAESKKPGMPVALDGAGALFKTFGVRDIPSVVLINAKGRIARKVGPQDRDLAAAVQALRVQRVEVQ